ncbi:MAG TPA: Smr/MutS family protein [Polyangiaceae bacterium]|nr:Smr/MutS family protein [Polyangiaceae bacterium]
MSDADDSDRTMPDDSESEQAIAVLPIEDSIDLHGFQPRDILDVVVDYLEAAQLRGFREVRLIHGRGTGTQRARIRALLAELGRVESFRDAPAARGGWGATLVYLKALE